jgi:hypothetical protein
MMNLYQHPDDYLERFHQERERIERRARLLRELRGAVPPFDGPSQRRLEKALGEQSPVCLEPSAR